MITWKSSPFNALSTIELYNYLALRNEVFIVEQNCPYQDLDGLEEQAIHLIAYEGSKAVACARLFAPGISYQEVSIGRVITKASHRKTGLGHQLMQKAISECDVLFGKQAIKIGAQAYLKKFYESHGFTTVSAIYLEDDIPHIKMLRN